MNYEFYKDKPDACLFNVHLTLNRAIIFLKEKISSLLFVKKSEKT